MTSSGLISNNLAPLPTKVDSSISSLVTTATLPLT